MTLKLSRLFENALDNDLSSPRQTFAKKMIFLTLKQLIENNPNQVFLTDETVRFSYFNKKKKILIAKEVEIDLTTYLRPSKQCHEKCSSPCSKHIRVECIQPGSFNGGDFGGINAGAYSVKMASEDGSSKIALAKLEVKPSKKIGKVIEDNEKLASKKMPFVNAMLSETYFANIAMQEQIRKHAFLSVQNGRAIITMPDLGDTTLEDYHYGPEDEDEASWDDILTFEVLKRGQTSEQRKTIQKEIIPRLKLLIRFLITNKIIENLQLLHAAGVVHRDITFKNIMLPAFEAFITLLINPANWGKDNLLNTCLIDFGFAHSANDRKVRDCGSTAFFAPEIVSRNFSEQYSNLSLTKLDNFSVGIAFLILLGMEDDFLFAISDKTDGKSTYYVNYDFFNDPKDVRMLTLEYIQIEYNWILTAEEISNMTNLLLLDNQARGSLEEAQACLTQLLTKLQAELMSKAESCGLIGDCSEDLSCNSGRNEIRDNPLFAIQRIGYLTFKSEEEQYQMKSLAVADMMPDSPAKMKLT